MTRLDRFIAASSRLLVALAGCVLGLLIALVVVDVVRRRTSGHTIPGSLEMSETMMVALVYLSLAHAARAGQHIRLEFLAARLPFRLRRATRVVGDLSAAGVVAAMAWATTDRAFYAYQIGEFAMGTVRWPTWPARITVAVGLWVLLAELMLVALRRFRDEADNVAAEAVAPNTGQDPSQGSDGSHGKHTALVKGLA